MSYGRGGIDRSGIGTWNATYKADSALKTLAGNGTTTLNRAAVIGKAVTRTGADECGYGSDGDALLGIIVQYEYDGYVTVQRRGYAVDVPVKDGSEPDVKDVVVVDGAGNVKKAPGTTFTIPGTPDTEVTVPVVYGPTVESVDTTANTCVLFLG
jgi:hypothetical protein